jgi:hypothetical protein
MPRTPRSEAELPFIDDLLAFGDDAPSIDQKLELIRHIRASSQDGGQQLDRALFDRLARMTQGMDGARAVQQELRDMLERLDSPPWHPALFLRVVPTERGARAMVLDGGARRVVAVASGIDLDALVTGEEVFLGSAGNVLAGRSPYGTPRCGETAFFERLTGDGRCVLRWRDEEVAFSTSRRSRAAIRSAGTGRRGWRSRGSKPPGGAFCCMRFRTSRAHRWVARTRASTCCCRR